MTNNENASEIKSRKVVFGLVLALVIIVEAFVFFCAFIYAGSTSALGYVSFAGTVISIILAVLAIIYTQTESVRQSSSSDRMYEAAAKINIAVESLAKKLVDLDSVKIEIEHAKVAIVDASTHGAEQINRAIENFDNKSSTVDKIHGELAELRRERSHVLSETEKHSNSAGNVSQQLRDSELVKNQLNVMATTSTVNTIPFLLSVLAAFDGLHHVDFMYSPKIDQYVSHLNRDSLLWSKNSVTAGMAIISTMFQYLLVISYNKSEDKVVVTPEYRNYLLDLCKKIESVIAIGEPYADILEAVKKINLTLDEYRG